MGGGRRIDVGDAPLLLMPVHLTRALVRNRYVYRLSGRDEDLHINIARRELLRRQFEIEIPKVDDDETPESYFAKIEPLLSAHYAPTR
jgi:hypothetical protein